MPLTAIFSGEKLWRTDLYSLGVLLYELPAGVLPFDPRRLRGAGFFEIQRVIRKQEPQVRFYCLGLRPARVIAE